MGTKARWGALDALPLDDVDPFDEVDLPQRVQDVGVPFDLRDLSTHDLHQRLAVTLEQEAKLFAAGVLCKVKERPDTSCHACPIYQGDRDNEEMAPYCRLSREQESILTMLAVRAEHGEG